MLTVRSTSMPMTSTGPLARRVSEETTLRKRGSATGNVPPARSASETYRISEGYEDAWIDTDRDGIITDAEVAAALGDGTLGFGSMMDADYARTFKAGRKEGNPSYQESARGH